MILEKEFVYKGYKCEVKINDSMGFRCGYVTLNNNIEIDSDSLDCHGGITYDQEFVGYRVIGFDCGHYGDGNDLDLCTNKEYVKTMRLFGLSNSFPVRTLEYCEGECIKIVNQIEELI